MRIVFAHEHPKVKRPDSIFLAGPSPHGKEDYNWRPEALDLLTELGFSGTVYVPLPRDGEWTDNYDGQIDWELEYLDAAGARVFWIPRSAELPGFTTNVEYGLYLKQPNMVLGYPENAIKMRYLDYVARHKFGVPVFHTLRETLACGIRLLG